MFEWCLLQSDEDGVLVAKGELDVDAVDGLREHLDDETITAVDLADVTFIDSCALAVLVAAHQARSSGLVLRRPSEPVLRILEVSGLDQYLPIER